MANTTREQMYGLLCEMQSMQRMAFDFGVNFEIGMRHTDTDHPWITMLVYREPFTPDSDETRKWFYLYDWRDLDENREIVQMVLDFVTSLKQEIKTSDNNQ